MQERRLTFRVREEGRIHSDRTFVLSPDLETEKVEFLVADATALPFRSGCFSCVASLNLIDKIAAPAPARAGGKPCGAPGRSTDVDIRPVFVVRGGMRSRDVARRR